jgi:peptidyl-tRNA hydrolase
MSAPGISSRVLPKTYYVLGLGNKGAQYASSRHNAGRLALESLVKKLNGTWDKHPRHDEFRVNILSLMTLIQFENQYLTHGDEGKDQFIQSILNESVQQRFKDLEQIHVCFVRLSSYMNLCGPTLSRTSKSLICCDLAFIEFI